MEIGHERHHPSYLDAFNNPFGWNYAIAKEVRQAYWTDDNFKKARRTLLEQYHDAAFGFWKGGASWSPFKQACYFDVSRWDDDLIAPYRPFIHASMTFMERWGLDRLNPNWSYLIAGLAPDDLVEAHYVKEIEPRDGRVIGFEPGFYEGDVRSRGISAGTRLGRPMLTTTVSECWDFNHESVDKYCRRVADAAYERCRTVTRREWMAEAKMAGITFHDTRHERPKHARWFYERLAYRRSPVAIADAEPLRPRKGVFEPMSPTNVTNATAKTADEMGMKKKDGHHWDFPEPCDGYSPF